MKKNKFVLGAAIAGLVGAQLVSAKVLRAEEKMGAGGGNVECWGINKCKGQGACGGPEGNSCAGGNSCKGKGWIELTKEDCLKKKGSLTPPKSLKRKG